MMAQAKNTMQTAYAAKPIGRLQIFDAHMSKTRTEKKDHPAPAQAKAWVAWK
jgi:hypothetical protein